MTRYYVGIDPGWSGGFAIVEVTGKSKEVCKTANMPDSEFSLAIVFKAMFSDLRRHGHEFVVCVEKVGGYMPGSGGNIGSAMFEFGRSAGAIAATLHSLDVKFTLITSSVWQKPFELPTRETKEDHKRDLKAKALELYPNSKPTLQTADAILLAHYASLL